ncbi:Ribosomal protein L7Ae [Terribacillus aidingensis]|uniref:Ribosomal protein L7Ae n=1 Tax=Terribacillus aidingensis TaxID=586416 RepID=A0A285NQ45_9BACI|nr:MULTISPECIES: ribosomal L7Ae/L30e/S12e/Gadd45 family protein [Terribacillus]QXE03134.1 ribosomal L7Ae/L30e/S12e/Gadd45 family protein [Terribacillus sp. DMT04]SNZ09741.1 Ribosomal protein L7Ae [Terribacillus aidingensis]
MSKNYLNLLGLAVRAGQCTFGEEAIVRDVQRQNAKLVIAASDIGPQTLKKLRNKTDFYNIAFLQVEEDREQLSQAVGKSGRVAIAVLDKGFADKLKSLLTESTRR